MGHVFGLLAACQLWRGMAASFVATGVSATGEAMPIYSLAAEEQVEAAVSADGDLNSVVPVQYTEDGMQELRQQVNGSTPTGYIDVGTPSVKMLVIFDTGSDKLVAKTW